MSLFTSFNSGVAGLHTAQSGLNTTAHNLANTKTPGYTRQQNIQKDAYYQLFQTTEKATMQIGYGTSVAAIRQIRDQFLDREYRTESGRLSFYEVQQTTAYEVYDIFGEMEGVEFNDALNTMWETIEELSTNPESITNRQLFITQAEAFLEKATNAYQALRDYQTNLNTQIQEQVKSINKIADEIGQLNLKIAKAEAGGTENANDYRDRRNYLMDELSKYTYFDYYEQSTGMVTIRINNAPLVEDTNVYHMACEKIKLDNYDDTTGQYNNSATTQMYKVVWQKSGFGDVYDLDKAYSREDNSDTGSLLGLLTARGQKYGYYTDIPVKEDYVSDLTYAQAVKDYNNTVGNCLLERAEAQLDLLVNKVVKAINDAFAPNVDLSQYASQDGAGNAITEITSTDGSTTIDLTGVKVLDANRCPVGADDDYTIGTELFVRKAQPERYQVYEVSGPVYITDDSGNQVAVTKAVPVVDANGNPVLDANGDATYTYQLYVYNEENKNDVNSLYTLQNLEINKKVQENYSYLPVMGNPDAGMINTYDQDLYNNMLAKWYAKDTMLDPNTLATYGTNDLYTAMVGAMGTLGSVWDSEVTNQESLLQSVEDKRQQISGVSTDEEMVSLLKYQHAYNAASRYITVIDSMLEHIISRLG